MLKCATPLACMLLVGCAGIRYSQDQKTFVAHGESFHVLFLKIPGDELELAKSRVPPGATEHTVFAYPCDWTSFWGVINRVLPGLHVAIISGTAPGRGRPAIPPNGGP